MSDLPTIDPASLTRVGGALRRPEGVCVSPDGSVWASDATGLVARVGRTVDRFGGGGVAPNGLAFDRAGRVVVADFGAGAVVRHDLTDARAETEVVATHAGDRLIRTPNFPAFDGAGRLWCSCSTLADEPQKALATQADDGFVFVVGGDGEVAVVAEGFRFANGMAFSPDGRWLYVVESGARVVSRLPVEDGRVTGGAEVVTPTLASVPDGVAFDTAGNLWISLVFPDPGVVLVTPDGEPHTVLEAPSDVIGRPSNLAFGGEDGRDLYLANLELDCLLHARVDIPGVVVVPC